jgi:hypothetical protein
MDVEIAPLLEDASIRLSIFAPKPRVKRSIFAARQSKKSLFSRVGMKTKPPLNLH